MPPDEHATVSSCATSSLAAVRSGSGRVAAWLVASALTLVVPAALAQGWVTGTDGLLPIPQLTTRVTDRTQTLTPAEAAALEAKLADWEARTSNQLAVLIVPTTQPESIEGYSLRVAEAWKIGRKGQDNGAVFLIAKNDRKMRIEVGYGLEGTLTDVTARRIIAEDVAPAFRENRFAAGIGAGVDRIIAVVAEGKPLPPRQAEKARSATRRRSISSRCWLILFVVVPIVGGVLRSIFGRLLGSTVGAGIVGAAAWFVAGSIAIAILAAIVGFVVMIFFGLSGGMARHGGGWGSTGGGGAAAVARAVAAFPAAAAVSVAVARRGVGE